MNLAQRVGRLLSGTPLYRPVANAHDILGSIVNKSPIPTLLDYYYIGRHGGLIEVTPRNTEFPSYLIKLTSHGKLQRQRARGVYEPHVMSFLDGNLTSDSVFWEFGAAWGYFSLAAATRVREVYSFEAMKERVEHLETATRLNNFGHLNVVHNELDGETSFDEYTPPDMVLVDIEGWEYIVLENALERLPDVSTWIVEVHSNLINNDTDEPERTIRALFEKSGYSVDVLNEWSQHNSHMVASQGD